MPHPYITIQNQSLTLAHERAQLIKSAIELLSQGQECPLELLNELRPTLSLELEDGEILNKPPY